MFGYEGKKRAPPSGVPIRAGIAALLPIVAARICDVIAVCGTCRTRGDGRDARRIDATHDPPECCAPSDDHATISCAIPYAFANFAPMVNLSHLRMSVSEIPALRADAI